ncbi:Gmad2 immunoglobulin-like domain-containing protein [Quadrisphaera setariae]|uniref:Bacterial spore germination immunoglobulin-like domain-containing protein n=1 Tax=Quadrisphaera setariae TaxID=2593304 RepID=A0A5C8ZHV9_9ACTN|nr:Gmad2 immunoglobulin-like domain-containing protein [Quadrisphaera setariae]TXR57144.1 hypothetical protein FMM08_06695 [Quadrisphaera setariae]
MPAQTRTQHARRTTAGTTARRTARLAVRTAVPAAALALLLAGCGGQASPETEPVGGGTSSAGASGTSAPPSSSSSATTTASASAATAAGPAATGTGRSASVVITAPTEGERLPAGPMGIVGQGSAPEGTLLYRITQADGAVLSDGYTDAGANGQVGDFSIPQTVQEGTCTPCTAEVWVPDESAGEGTVPTGAAKVTFTVG